MAQEVPSHWIFFGDGEQGDIISSWEEEEPETGMMMTHFKMRPSIRIEHFFPDVKQRQDMQTGIVEMQYPSVYVIWKVRGIVRSRCEVLLDFNGNPTKMSRMIEEKAEELKRQQRLTKIAKAGMYATMEELNKARTQQVPILYQQAKQLKAVRSAAGRTDDKDLGEGMSEEEVPSNG